jgi:hypothetical protein
MRALESLCRRWNLIRLKKPKRKEGSKNGRSLQSTIQTPFISAHAFPESFQFGHEPGAEGKGFSFGVVRISIQAMGFEQVGPLLEVSEGARETVCCLGVVA